MHWHQTRPHVNVFCFRHTVWVGLCVIALTACGTTATIRQPTPSVTTASPTVAASADCPALNTVIQMAQQSHKTVGFAMNVQPNLAVKGSMATSADAPSTTLTGSGFIVNPNDPVQLRLTTVQGVTITIVDTHTQQSTAYVVTACAAKATTDLALTGSVPAAFVADLLTTPST